MHATMIEIEKLANKITSAFPSSPAPERIIRESRYFIPDSDIPQSLNENITGKLWRAVGLHDWAMVGTTPGIARYYMTADAFHYYIPSILTHVCRTGQYPEFAIDSLSPPKVKETFVRDELEVWWKTFMGCFTLLEKNSVCEFIEYITCRDDIFSFEKDGLHTIWS
jgi:hypothetical protein